MFKRGVLWLGLLAMMIGCNTTGAKRPENIEAHPEEFVPPPPGSERPPDFALDNNRLLPTPSGKSLNMNPAQGIGSPSPNFTPGMRR